jgi:hypothetical protein
MKTNRLIWAATLLAAVLITVIACRKGVDSSSGPKTPPDEQVEASLEGRVLDENGFPVKEAAVTSGSATTTTDIDGVFRFTNIRLSTRFGFVKVTKPGYFTGSRSILTNAHSQNFVEIHLLPRELKGSFTAASGGAITVEGGNTVSFGAGAVMNAGNGAVYSGNVHVYATYLDPTASDLPGKMPGDLRGIRASGQETGLQSFGMMAVDLEGDGGEKLQLAAGKTATVRIAIPASLQSTAPANIPLWHFDDSTGKWIEEGTSVRQGNYYVGQVGHFSFWNWDLAMALVGIKARVVDQHGNPLVYKIVQLSSPAYGTREGVTDTSGFLQGWLPKDQTFVLKVLDGCRNVLHTQNVGPTVGDLDLGTLSVTLNTAPLTLSGTVVNCFGKPVVNGHVIAMIEGLPFHAAVTNGSFTMNVSRCSSAQTKAMLTAIDFDADQQGSAVPVYVGTGVADAGELSACGQVLDQYITFTLKGLDFYLMSPRDTVLVSPSYELPQYGTITDIEMLSRRIRPVVNAILMLSELHGTGDVTVAEIDLVAMNGVYYSEGTPACTITRYGGIGEYIEGTFSGMVKPQGVTNAEPVPVTGSFRIKRVY